MAHLANLMSAWYDEAMSADLGYAAGSLEQAESRPAFIEIDLKNAFNSHSRQAAFDTLAGKATKDYVGAGVLSGEALPHLAELQKFFPYFRNMYAPAATLRFYDSTGQVHHISGTTGSQQGDSAAMLNFSHVTHPLWGGIMGQYPSARAAAYADDGFVRDTLLTVLRILAALKHAFKEDLGMELTLPKCKVLIPGLSQEDANDAIRSVISSHAELSSLQDMVSDEALARHSVGDRPMTILDVVKVDGLTCVGVPIGTPAFMRDWAGVKLRDQIQDLQKLRLMSDPLIHYHLVRFCGLARPGYMCRTLPPDLMRDAGIADFDHAISTEIFTKGVGERWREWSDTTMAWHRTTLQLPHHRGGLGLTPACASSIAAFYTATARSVRWFSGLRDPTFWIKDDLSCPDTWTSSALSALRAVHQLLLQDYHCVEVDPLAQRPAAAANAPAAPQGAASPLQLPPLKSLAQPDSSGPADGTAATSSRLPKQKRITKQILPHWKPHEDSIQAPPDEFCKHLRDLHLTQVVEAAPDAEEGDPRHSILTACMSDGDKSRKLHFTPAAWLSCLSTSDGVMAFTEGEWQNWFCSFLGVPLPSMLTLIANNRKCPCGRPYDAHAHHVHTCIRSNKTRAHNLLQDCLISLASDTDFKATNRVPTIEVNDRQLRADIYLPHLVVGGVGRGLCIDVSRVHDFHGNAANQSLNGTLRHADINQVLSHRAQEKINKYRAGYAALDVRRAFLPAVVSTSGRIHGDLLRLLYLLADNKTKRHFRDRHEAIDDDSEAYCWRRSGFFWRMRASLGLACAQATTLAAQVFGQGNPRSRAGRTSA